MNGDGLSKAHGIVKVLNLKVVHALEPGKFLHCVL